jgi:rfaE bifunctional protein nucleotidyltransferase chain/domain
MELPKQPYPRFGPEDPGPERSSYHLPPSCYKSAMPEDHPTEALAYQRKISTLEQARLACASYREASRRVVFTNGCFDLLHPGHVRYLAMARALGDVLVVGLNADASVRRLKGESRPLQNEAARAEVLAALACVDHVVIFPQDDPLALILEIRPDYLAKGADWAAEEIIGGNEVRAWGGKVARIQLVEGHSTSHLVEKARH